MRKEGNLTAEAQLRAGAKYDAVNTKRYSIKLNKNTDADILTKLESVDGFQAYIKKLIRDDISRSKS